MALRFALYALPPPRDSGRLFYFLLIGTLTGIGGGMPLIAVSMGVMTATFGGIARDVLCRSNLTLMNEEFYITTVLAGSIVYLILLSYDLPYSYDLIGGFCVAFLLRALAIRFKIKLPNLYRWPNVAHSSSQESAAF